MSGDGGTPVRVVADRARCIGAGQCVSLAPEIFDQDDAGLVVTTAGATLPAAAVRWAIELCPSGAIAMLRDAP